MMADLRPHHAPLSLAGFVGLLASAMALNSAALSIVIPSMPGIGAAFDVADPNAPQAILSIYLIGFGLGQPFVGVLGDRWGRKPILLGGLAIFAIATWICARSPDLLTLLIARFVQGFASASPRVIGLASIRDCYAGRTMARVTSLTMMVFMIVPVVAPSVGQLLVVVGSWRSTFDLMAVGAVVVVVLCAVWLPETLPRHNRRMITWSVLSRSIRGIVGCRQTIGYTLAAGAFYGAVLGFMNSSEQILVETLGLGKWYTLALMAVSACVCLAALFNARVVERLGMRKLTHGAACLYLGISAVMVTLAIYDVLSVAVFLALISGAFVLMGVVFANFNALAMEPQVEVAGMASALVGAVSIILGATIGHVVGQAYDGTIVPLAFGFLFCASVTLTIVIITERGKLFGADVVISS